MLEVAFTKPLPVYAVAFSDTLAAGGWGVSGSYVEIPLYHKRPGDAQDNKALWYSVSASGAGWTPPAYLALYDQENIPGVAIYAAAPTPYIHLAGGIPLRLAAVSGNVTYHVMAYYDNPTGR